MSLIALAFEKNEKAAVPGIHRKNSAAQKNFF
jgi:hypothetical protein